MKLTTLKKSLLTLAVLMSSASANAGVIASSNLTVEDFKLNDGTGITIAGGTREGSVLAAHNGVSGLNNGTVSSGPVANVNALLTCAGPDCSAVGADNSNTPIYGTALLNDYQYTMADMAVEGNAFTGTSQGFTLSEVSLGKGISESGTSNSNITNTLNSAISFDFDPTTASSDFRSFSLNYAWDLASIITPDIAFDDYKTATTSADLSLTISIKAISGGFGDVTNALANGAVQTSDTLSWTIVDESVSGTDGALWNTFFPGANSDVDGSGGFLSFFSGDFELFDGGYQISVTQSSTAKATLVSEPMSLAIFGLGLLGLSRISRKKA